jgi:predicted N-acetyltransferase YhbS
MPKVLSQIDRETGPCYGPIPADSGAATTGGEYSGVYRLEEETEEDWWEVEALYDLCFAPGRTALSSYRLRDGVPTVAPLCLTLRDDDNALAAVIRYWPALIGEDDVLLLGPIAVHPTHQGEGLGALLINESLAEARRLGWERVMLVGDAPYYARFGFRKLEGVAMPPPTNPDRILGLDLKVGAWAGVTGVVAKAT